MAPSIVVTQTKNGSRGFGCSHNSCVDYRWGDFRKKVGIGVGQEPAAPAARWQNWREAFHLVEELKHGEVPYFIDKILPEGVTFVGSLSGVGKTWFGLSLSRALATGQKFAGLWTVPEAMNVLYLCPEMGEKAFRKRCEQMGLKDCPRFRCQTIADGMPVSLKDPILAAYIAECHPAILLDTAIRFSLAQDENAATLQLPALTIPQASVLSNLPTRRIRDLIAPGQVRFQRQGKKLLIPREDLLAYLESNWQRNGT